MEGYLANGLFSIGDRLLNSLLAKKLREAVPGINLYVPQENDEINDKEAYADSLMIAKADYDKLMDSDFLVCLILPSLKAWGS